MGGAGGVELTVLMPCLDEAETVAGCVAKARAAIDALGIDGEVLVVDNGSTDGSPELATAAGARVVHAEVRGYGAALRTGIEQARGRYVVMGDADDSYDFSTIGPFVERLRAGDDLVVGNRFAGGIAPGAMPRLHRYVGNPVLSFVGRLLFRSPVRDFHCGLRGVNREAALALDLRTTGMEFASEMIVKATLDGHRVSEVPTTLSPDGRSRPPHLRSWHDGWRHLRFLLGGATVAASKRVDRAAVVVACAIQVVWFALDRAPRFFLGDSIDYLSTSFGTGYFPETRTWLYGAALNPIGRTVHALWPYLVVNVLAGVALCVAVGHLARLVLGASRRTALVLTAVASTEPLLVWYERSILPEVVATTMLFVGTMVVAHAVARAGSGRSTAIGAGCLALAAALRSAFVAPVLALLLLIVAHAGLAVWRARPGLLHRRVAARAARRLALPMALVVLLGAMALLNGAVADGPATLSPRRDLYLTGTVAPLLRTEDFAGLPVEEPGELLLATGAPERERRNLQLYARDGLVRVLERRLGDRDLVLEILGEASRHAVRRAPLGFAHLLLTQAIEYAEPAQARDRFLEWTGTGRPLAPDFERLLDEHYGGSPGATAPGRGSPARWWLWRLSWWPALVYVLAAGLAVVVAVGARRTHPGHARSARVVAVALGTYLAGMVALSPMVVPRYLLPAVPFVLVLGGSVGPTRERRPS